MFVGHFAAGLAAKKFAPRVNLGWLLTAACLTDLVFTLFLLLGIEHARIVPGLSPVNPMDLYDYPWSHSLLATIVWALLAGGGWTLWRRDRRGGLVIGVAVFSHWILDWVSHLPDMPLWPGGGPKLGLGLWNSVAATLLVEGGLWLAGIWIYLRATAARDRSGRWGAAPYFPLLSLIYLSAFFAPPPPDIRVVAWVNLSLFIFLLWPAWFDRHRDSA